MQPQSRSDGRPAPSTIEQMRAFTSWVVLILRSISISAEVYLRKGFGQRYFGLEAALVIPVILVYCLFWPGEDLGYMMAFLAGYLALCLNARVNMLFRGSRGEPQHSRYTGRPRLMRLLPWMGELAIKRYVEPVLLIFLGGVLTSVNPPLGAWLMLAGFAMLASNGMDDAVERARLWDMQDTLFDQARMNGRLRGLTGMLR